MSQAITVDGESIRHHGWRVTFAGMGINLALGVLYTWSVISKRVPEDWGWSEVARSLPYSVACLVFSLVMVPAGRMQDRVGPRLVATIGGILVGIGMIGAYFTTTPIGYVITIGVLAGAGIGFGYASATPPAVKWFSKAKTGLIAGIVVSGFGLASVYAAPAAKWLIGLKGLPFTMMVFGVGFLIIVVALAQLLKAPPAGYVPPDQPPVPAVNNNKKEDFLPREMLRTWQFYVLWFMYACGAGAGLMIIAKMDPIASDQAKLTLGFLLVAVLAVGNGAGRILAGMLSDKIGRKATMFICFVLQAAAIGLLSQATPGSTLATVPMLTILAAVIGANYGANLSLFPSITKDYYGLKNFGMNYGLVFTAWGVGGFMLALLAGKVYDATKSFDFAYFTASGLLILAAITVFFVKAPHHEVPSAPPDGA
ncbi:MAG: OFA family MFS transporter [Planctomycetota bacterium]